MSSSVIRGGNLVVTEEGIRDSVRSVLLPLWSTYYFFTLYANNARRLGASSGSGGDGYVATPVTDERIPTLGALDRYILSKTHELVADVTRQQDAYDIAGACESVRVYLDVLTNWYVRTQRDRFWAEDADAFDTLYTVLETLCRVAAPLAPLLTEEIWRGLTGGRSVHLADWPTTSESVEEQGEGTVTWGLREVPAVPGTRDDVLIAAMDEVRSVVSTALSLRKANKLRVRQPLARLTVAALDPAALTDYAGLLSSELNVKDVELVKADAGAAERFGIVERLAVNARAAGPRLGRGVQSVIKAAKAGAWARDEAGAVVVTTDDGEVPLLAAEYELTTVVGGDGAAGALAAAVLPGGGFAVLDLALTPELEAEGYVRDVVRDVQDARKSAGLEVGDRIDLVVGVPADRVDAVGAHADLLRAETLAVTLTVTVAEGDRTITVAKAG
jgi:isoleucyl-tRNA synthetase